MKTMLLFIATMGCALGDTYVAYFVKGAPDLFKGASGEAVLALLHGPDVVIEAFAETESNLPNGTNQTHVLEYTVEGDDSGTLSKASREVGTKFKVKEDGDKVSFEFSDTRLDRWISLSKSGNRFLPVFTTKSVRNTVILKRGRRVVFGGAAAEALPGGTPLESVEYTIIERK